jgi:hypothetical protein
MHMNAYGKKQHHFREKTTLHPWRVGGGEARGVRGRRVRVVPPPFLRVAFLGLCQVFLRRELRETTPRP